MDITDEEVDHPEESVDQDMVDAEEDENSTASQTASQSKSSIEEEDEEGDGDDEAEEFGQYIACLAIFDAH
jgi:hypothetical protein